MKIKAFALTLVPTLLVLTLALTNVSHAADASSKPAIYDESLDGQKQLTQAQEQAKKDNKVILLQFGANWCGWCHKLHKLFDTDQTIHSKLQKDYVIVMVDVNKGHNSDFAAKYNADKHGLPCIVILDSNGKHLTTKDTGELEEGDHHSPEKVIAFLNQWSAKKS
jgi:thiol:disulfide interchange protein